MRMTSAICPRPRTMVESLRLRRVWYVSRHFASSEYVLWGSSHACTDYNRCQEFGACEGRRGAIPSGSGTHSHLIVSRAE